MDNAEFFSLWRQFQGREEEDHPLCPVAAEFLDKLDDVIFAPLRDKPSRGQVAQAKYMLQEEWHAWKQSVPEPHLQCLADAYEASYQRLDLMELRRRPVINIILDYEEVYDELTRPESPPPPSSPTAQVPALFLGELEEEEG